MYICIYIHTHTHTHTHIYIYIYIYIHTSIYTKTYKCTHRNLLVRAPESTLTATLYNTLQHTATHCNTLQHTLLHTATHCNILGVGDIELKKVLLSKNFSTSQPATRPTMVNDYSADFWEFVPIYTQTHTNTYAHAHTYTHTALMEEYPTRLSSYF